VLRRGAGWEKALATKGQLNNIIKGESLLFAGYEEKGACSQETTGIFRDFLSFLLFPEYAEFVRGNCLMIHLIILC